MTYNVVIALISVVALCVGGCDNDQNSVSPTNEPMQNEVIQNQQEVPVATAVNVEVEANGVKTDLKGQQIAAEQFNVNLDIQKSVKDIKAQAAAMDVQALHLAAMKYKESLGETQEDLKLLSKEINAIPQGEKSAFLENIQKLTLSMITLRERYQVYADELKAKGGDVNSIKI